MGRPLPKKFFGFGEGDQLAIRAKIGSASEGQGFIVKQKGSSRYIATVGSDTGVVTLVDKDDGTLLAGEATITFTDEEENTKRVKKVLRHRVAFFDDTGAQWSFDPATGGIWEATEADGDDTEYTITINTQPADQTVEDGSIVTFTVDASISPSGTLIYQWQYFDGEGYNDFEDGEGVSGSTSDTLEIGPVGTDWTVRVIVSDDENNAADVTSNSATATVEEAAPVITIDTQPANFVGDDGDIVTFTVVASVDPSQALTYQWQFNDNGGEFGNLSNGGGVTGATTDTVSLGAGSASLNTNTYRVVVSSAGAEDVISEAATVTIAPA